MSKWARYKNGFSRSRNAELAEKDGRFPLMRAVDAVYKRYDCKGRVTRKDVRGFLEKHWDGEWHHVGKYAARIGYYNSVLSVDDLRSLFGIAKDEGRRT